MGLPLLFGIISYLVIMFYLIVWLTRYHSRKCQVLSNPDGVHQDVVLQQDDVYRSGYHQDGFINQSEDSKNTLNHQPSKNPGIAVPGETNQSVMPSGDQSLCKKAKGGMQRRFNDKKNSLKIKKGGK